MEVIGKMPHTPAALPLCDYSRCPSYRRLGGPQDQSGCGVWK